jgi:hypothetical protein
VANNPSDEDTAYSPADEQLRYICVLYVECVLYICAPICVLNVEYVLDGMVSLCRVFSLHVFSVHHTSLTDEDAASSPAIYVLSM